MRIITAIALIDIYPPTRMRDKFIMSSLHLPPFSELLGVGK
jgi:hypothetical protein